MRLFKMPLRMAPAEEYLGMTKEVLAEKLKKAEEAATAATEAKTAVEGLNTKLETGLTELKTTLAGISAGLTNRTPNRAAAGDNGGGANNNSGDNTEVVPDFDLDPQGFIAHQIQKATGPSQILGLTTLASNEFDKFRRKTQRDKNPNGSLKFPFFDKFESEIEELVGKQPLQMRCNPNAIENAYNVVVGRHASEIADDASKKGGVFFTESASNQGSGHNGNDSKMGSAVVTDLDKQQAAKFGIPLEKYMKSKAALKPFNG